MDDEGARPCPPTASHGHAELGAAAEAVGCGEHDAGRRRRVRRRARRGPCGGARRGWRGPHAYACAAGSRASWPGAGCSAGRSACSPVRLSTRACRRFRRPERWLSTGRPPGSGHGETGCCQACTRYVGARTRVKPARRPPPVDKLCGKAVALSSPFLSRRQDASDIVHTPGPARRAEDERALPESSSSGVRARPYPDAVAVFVPVLSVADLARRAAPRADARGITAGQQGKHARRRVRTDPAVSTHSNLRRTSSSLSSAIPRGAADRLWSCGAAVGVRTTRRGTLDPMHTAAGAGVRSAGGVVTAR